MTEKVIVSVTSIFSNQKKLLNTLNSILNQTILPDACYIFLSEESYLLDDGFKNKTITHPQLYQLIEENPIFKLRWTFNEGPYRKLLPILKEKWDQDCVVITIDDDTIYHPKLVEKLLNDYNKYNACIGSWGFTLKFNKLLDIKYESKKGLNIPFDLYNFSIGKGAILYHPKFFMNTKELIFNRTIYLSQFPTCDDMWFNFIRIVNNTPCFINNFAYMIKDQHNQNKSLYETYNKNTNNNHITRIIILLKKMNLLHENTF
jgi:hypothetical protein